jgi:hypothetical protein
MNEFTQQKSIVHIDKNNKRFHLFDLEFNGAEDYTIKFTEETKRFFPKGFSENDYTVGSSNDFEKISLFMKNFLPDNYNNSDDFLGAIKSVEKNRAMPIHSLNSSTDDISDKFIGNKNILDMNNMDNWDENLDHLLDKDSKILEKSGERYNTHVNGFLKDKMGGYRHVVIKSTKDKETHEDTLNMYMQYVINKSLRQDNVKNIHSQSDVYDTPNMEIYTDKKGKTHLIQERFDRKPFQAKELNHKGQDGIAYRKSNFGGDLVFNLSSIQHFYLGKSLNSTSENGYLAASKIYSSLNKNLVSNNMKQVIPDPKLTTQYVDEKTSALKSMTMFNVMMGNLDMGANNIFLSYKPLEESESKCHTLEVAPFIDLEAHLYRGGTSNPEHMLNGVSLNMLDMNYALKNNLKSNWVSPIIQAEGSESWIEGKRLKNGVVDMIHELEEKKELSPEIAHGLLDYFKQVVSPNMTFDDSFKYSADFNKSIEKKYKNQQENVIIDTFKDPTLNSVKSRPHPN